MKGKIVLFGFGLFWTAMTLLFDGLTVVPAARQLMTYQYSKTEGTILSSSVTEHSGDDGPTYGVEVSYSHTVNGKEYRGYRRRFQGFSSSSDSGWAHKFVNDHPSDTKVCVFYNPRNPEEAVLVQGLEGSDLFLAMFMTPFNAVMIGIWWFCLGQARQRWLPSAAGGVKIRSEARQTRARLTAFSPLAVGFLAMGMLAFLTMFAVAFLGGGFHPKMSTVVSGWAVIFAGAITAGGWHWLKVLSGKYDMVIDELAGAVEVPATSGRKTSMRFPACDVRDVTIDYVVKTSNEGGTTTVYVPTLRLAGGREEKLMQFYDEGKAKAFSDWLRGKLPRGSKGELKR